MIHRLPAWIWTWAWVLAFMAGAINVVGFLSFEHQGITHLTGTTSLLAIAASEGAPGRTLHLLLVLLSFVLGAAMSGAIVRERVLRIGRPQAIVLALEAGLLAAAVAAYGRELPLGAYCAGVACGLQNAMITTFSGAVVRTSHVTGMFTDLGLFLGYRLRGIPVERRRVSICLTVISGFFAGGIVGGLVFPTLRYGSLYIPAALALALAAASLVYGHRGEDPSRA